MNSDFPVPRTYKSLLAKYNVSDRRLAKMYLLGELEPEDEDFYFMTCDRNLLLAVALAEFGCPLLEELKKTNRGKR